MKEYAKSFYKSKAWQETRYAYLSSQHFICERCGCPAKIVHHKKYITPANINDPYITLSWDNLEALCQECHNEEHLQEYNQTFFNEDGEIEKVKAGRSVKQFEKATAKIDDLIAKAKKML